MPNLPSQGVIGGVSVSEITRARRWAAYELGRTATVPRAARPDWLVMSDAAHAVEEARVEIDPDEPPVDR